MSDLIQITINSATDAHNAVKAIMAFANGFSSGTTVSGPEKPFSFSMPEMPKPEPEPVEKSGETFMVDTQKQPEPEIVEEDIFGNDSESVFDSSGDDEIVDIFESSEPTQESGDTPVETEIDASSLNLDKQRYTKNDRVLIEAACKQHGVSFDSKISTSNLAKKLKKAIGGSESSEPPEPQKEETKSVQKVSQEDLRKAIKVCADSAGKEKIFAELESRFGEKLLSKIDESKHPLVMSLCKAFMAIKQVIDKKGSGEAMKLLTLIGGPDCKKLSVVGDDKLDALTKACGEILNG